MENEKHGLLNKIESNYPKPEKKLRTKKSILVRVFNRIIIILALFIVILFAVYFLFLKNKPDNPITNIIAPPPKTEVTSALIKDQLSYWQEFVTFKYRYSNICTIKKTGRIFSAYTIVKYSGVIRAGIADITEAEIKISEDGKKLEIKLPEAEILGNEISSQEVFDEQKNIFMSVKTQEIFDKIEEDKMRAQDDLLTDGLLLNARNYAKEIITQIFLTAGFEEVIVE